MGQIENICFRTRVIILYFYEDVNMSNNLPIIGLRTKKNLKFNYLLNIWITFCSNYEYLFDKILFQYFPARSPTAAYNADVWNSAVVHLVWKYSAGIRPDGLNGILKHIGYHGIGKVRKRQKLEEVKRLSS